jgi:hypothetical protein
VWNALKAGATFAAPGQQPDFTVGNRGFITPRTHTIHKDSAVGQSLGLDEDLTGLSTDEYAHYVLPQLEKLSVSPVLADWSDLWLATSHSAPGASSDPSAHSMPRCAAGANENKKRHVGNPAFVAKQRLYDLGIQETPELKVWGGWEVEPPGGPGHPLIIDFARKEHPLLIWDSLVEFHTGDEQSSTQTREFMRQFRNLANLGATVVILHHTGKSESAQEYRGSSDIEAAVDMAFKLAAVGSKTELDRLTLKPFKTRLMPLPERELRYVKRKGFELSAVLAKPGDDGPDAAYSTSSTPALAA